MRKPAATSQIRFPYPKQARGDKSLKGCIIYYIMETKLRITIYILIAIILAMGIVAFANYLIPELFPASRYVPPLP